MGWLILRRRAIKLYTKSANLHHLVQLMGMGIYDRQYNTAPYSVFLLAIPSVKAMHVGRALAAQCTRHGESAYDEGPELQDTLYSTKQKIGYHEAS